MYLSEEETQLPILNIRDEKLEEKSRYMELDRFQLSFFLTIPENGKNVRTPQNHTGTLGWPQLRVKTETGFSGEYKADSNSVDSATIRSGQTEESFPACGHQLHISATCLKKISLEGRRFSTTEAEEQPSPEMRNLKYVRNWRRKYSQ